MSKRTIRDWPRLIAEYRRSGETQRGFCRRRNLSVNTLQYHLKRMASQAGEVALSVGAPSGFIDLSPASSSERVELELKLPSGAVLRLRG